MLINKKTTFIIGFWVTFVTLFVIGHFLLSKIILYYQQSPARETAEAYQVISSYKQAVEGFYKQYGRCPTLADKKQIIPQIKAYTYVKVIRLLADEQTNTCFVTAVMRSDTPSQSVKGQLITLAYRVAPTLNNSWSCYTSITNIYTVFPCRDNPLPINFQRALTRYKKDIK